ncbi:7-carboxy-7-deazaguanine synthase QueE [Kitasatospora sp. NA04385]|uniref:7-carboxy-7-deazaguanine synthase QueE n=1 Tax=Kitasatospora sp. NA04385 TaxID=2742135 RepID=UPI00159234DB|nr:7-carboxy-7-deazaguanine synthase QueE [Kitasatospora sp. NA04385]QKW22310.1 7-carboxy-7-deazaguanine synthase QueE [Kitasatospora sp. NA04385]
MSALVAPASLPVAEVFGPTIQGEGPSAGQNALFLRLGACNLSCTWCDTPYTWDGKRFDLRQEIRRVPVVDLAEATGTHPHALIVITGGEPLLHQSTDAWRSLMAVLRYTTRRVEIETNGTLAPKPVTLGVPRLVFNVSPKLANSGMPQDRRIKPEALEAFTALANAGRARFKFVAANSDDLEEIAVLADRFHIPPHATWVMPEGVTPEQTIAAGRALAEDVIGRHWNLTLRQHVLLWPGERER